MGSEAMQNCCQQRAWPAAGSGAAGGLPWVGEGRGGGEGCGDTKWIELCRDILEGSKARRGGLYL